MTERAEAIADRVCELRARIAEAAARAGRDPDDVGVVAVTKKQPPDVVAAAREAGLVHVGENYVQELLQKRDALGDPSDLRWHFVGKLQRNKAKFLAGGVELVHALDSESAARALSTRAAAAGLVQPVLAAVNVGGEAQKSGVSPSALSDFLSVLGELPGVRCDGLMTMPPQGDDAEASRRYFRALRELRDRHQRPDRPLTQLSMGTTGDFEVAVEEGATWVRVGTAVLGERP